MKERKLFNKTIFLTLFSLLILTLLTGCGRDYNTAEVQSGDVLASVKVENYDEEMVFLLYKDAATKTVANFVKLAKDHEYDGKSFDRIISGYMAECSLENAQSEDETEKLVKSEIDPDIQPYYGTLCAVPVGVNKESGGGFFIVNADSYFLRELKKMVEYKDKTMLEYLKIGYDSTITEDQLEEYYDLGGAPWLAGNVTVFGRLVSGSDVLRRMSLVSVSDDYVPLEDVVIESITIYTQK